MRKIITWFKSLFVRTDVIHPLNDAILKLTTNKTFEFAKGKRSVVNGYCKVKSVRYDRGINLIDIYVKITQDEPKRYYKTEKLRKKYRRANINYYISKSDLVESLKLVGMKNFQIGNITLI